VRTLLRGA